MCPECKNHKMWQTQLLILSWGAIALGAFFLLFTDDMTKAIIFLLVSVAASFSRVILDIRHVRWHISQDEDDE